MSGAAAAPSDATAVATGGEADIRAILDALGMSRRALRGWLADERAFCEKHGGARRYAELMALLDECAGALDAPRVGGA